MSSGRNSTRGSSEKKASRNSSVYENENLKTKAESSLKKETSDDEVVQIESPSAHKSSEHSIIEISDTEYPTPKPRQNPLSQKSGSAILGLVKSEKFGDQLTLAACSPNSNFKPVKFVKNEDIKAIRKMELLDLDNPATSSVLSSKLSKLDNINDVKSLQIRSVVRGYTQAATEKNLGFEAQLQVLSREMLGVLESKPGE